MKTFVLAGLLGAGTAVLSDAGAAPLLGPGTSPQERGVIANSSRPLNVDIPAFLWLIADNQSKRAYEPRQPQREIKDASLGLESKMMA
jgi:hypothetical protein